MTFETFWNGKPIKYMGSDGFEYVAAVRSDKDFPDQRRTQISRADGSPVVALGVSYPAGYVLGHGKSTAFMMHDEALRYPAAA